MKLEATTPLQCLIIDDESSAHKTLKFHMGKVPWLEFTHSCMNAVRALELISSIRPDIIFLDVDMPHLSGIEMLGLAGRISASVILTTAHEKFAIQGYEYDVTDFLLKPISFPRFLRAVNKVRERGNPDPSRNERPAAAATNEPHPHHPFQIVDCTRPADTALASPADSPVFAEKMMWVKVDKNIYPLEYKHIYMIQSYGNYVQIYSRAHKLVVRTSLTLLLKNLPPHFIQTHRSYIINSAHISHISGNEIYLTDLGFKAMISKELRNDFLRRLPVSYG
ncbi:LytR/AlgR family response regulator transcription factor [Dyadobacter pollutisoli]|uniref:Response regulator transcription factor n=1 Tax=Dyadobacter pollutisoli TaxID=2910158 RepID=A0A9E8NDF1_9BACT|nr:response regulator transcription factor [Dyadobacter pollutisoli]WAC13273.1 response regulator transcription factor [Dyadobacter pollutisoli]